MEDDDVGFKSASTSKSSSVASSSSKPQKRAPPIDDDDVGASSTQLKHSNGSTSSTGLSSAMRKVALADDDDIGVNSSTHKTTDSTQQSKSSASSKKASTSSAAEATIVAKKVIGRYNSHFKQLKIKITASFDELRRFMVSASQEKTGGKGFKNTCDYIQLNIGEAIDAVKTMQHCVDGDEGIVDSATNIMYDDGDDAKREKVLKKFVKETKEISKYITHFKALIQNVSLMKAAESALKHDKTTIAFIDNAKKLLTRVVDAFKNYLQSNKFTERLMAPDSMVAIMMRDLTGTEAAKKKFIAELQKKDDDESESSLDNVVPEEEFVVDEDGKPKTIEELEADEEKKRQDGDFSDKDAAKDKERDSEGETTSEDEASSEGGALFEANIKKNPHNRMAREYVKRNAYAIPTGQVDSKGREIVRTLRNSASRMRMQAFGKQMQKLEALHVYDNREPSKKTNQRANDNDEDEEDDDDEEHDITESSEDDGDCEVVARMVDLVKQRADQRKALAALKKKAKDKEKEASRKQREALEAAEAADGSSDNISEEKPQKKRLRKKSAADDESNDKASESEKTAKRSRTHESVHKSNTKTKERAVPDDE